MRIYAEKEMSLETLWKFFDKENVFPDIKTLYRYHRSLFKQIDEILRTVLSGISTLDSAFSIPEFLPGEQTIQRKLSLLFSMLDRLIDLLHQKNIFGIILLEEQNCFLHAYLYQKAGIILLNSS